MSYFLGIIAAALSFGLNRVLFGAIGYKTIITYSPVIEEVCKSIPAYFIDADILMVHVTFGAIEGFYEFWQGKGLGKLAALLSVIGHFLFGLSVITILMLSGSIYLAVLTSILFHLFWNFIVVKFF